MRYLPATGSVSAVATSADGQTAVAGTSGGDVLRWSLTDFGAASWPGCPPLFPASRQRQRQHDRGRRWLCRLVWEHGAGVRRVPVPAGWKTVAAGVSPSGQYVVFSLGNPARASLLNPDGTPWLLLVNEQTGSSAMARADVSNPAVSLSFDGETSS